MSLLFEQVYNPDILNCLANRSNDEVFTPPEVVNKMLDMLPQELFKSPDTTFLDPACKTGVFLREIAKRLLEGLKDVIPDENERRRHIFTKQLYGIAITELTSLLSRRSLYCSKYANSIYSIVPFENVEGNIRFKNMEHYWEGSKCGFCGASKSQYDREEGLEQHAYEFIHTSKPEEIFEMTFDVIIGNPPYLISDGGNAASAIPIYHEFVKQAVKLNPRYLSMIIPARWMQGGRGLEAFRQDMLFDNRIRELHDFENASDCFPGVEIKGGVCYFLWSRDEKGKCRISSYIQGNIYHSERYLLEKGLDVYIRSPLQLSILNKTKALNEDSFSEILNAGRHFGFHTKVEWENNSKGFIQTADGKSRLPFSAYKTSENDIRLYFAKGTGWISRKNVQKNTTDIDKYKILLPRSGNPGSTVIGKPIISEPNSCSSNTYVVALPKTSIGLEEAENMITYIKTYLFRFLVAVRTSTQDIAPKAYEFVPIQDFSKPWTDKELYAKYGLTDEEIAFIESMIRPMD